MQSEVALVKQLPQTPSHHAVCASRPGRWTSAHLPRALVAQSSLAHSHAARCSSCSKRWLVPRILNGLSQGMSQIHLKGMSRERACPLIIQGLVLARVCPLIIQGIVPWSFKQAAFAKVSKTGQLCLEPCLGHEAHPNISCKPCKSMIRFFLDVAVESSTNSQACALALSGGFLPSTIWKHPGENRPVAGECLAEWLVPFINTSKWPGWATLKHGATNTWKWRLTTPENFTEHPVWEELFAFSTSWTSFPNTRASSISAVSQFAAKRSTMSTSSTGSSSKRDHTFLHYYLQ